MAPFSNETTLVGEFEQSVVSTVYENVHKDEVIDIKINIFENSEI